ncbi:hypothetical protein A0256_19125 [Mucilaginibacter sp. PAMC 26640]|nr:hypothetical protein A0256_19125 [Mucilaginibacter sp. PAMC 26640]
MTNSKQFMESGMLEAYCLGSLDTAGQAEVLEMCLIHPELRMELTEIENNIERFSNAFSVEPPSHLRENILNTLFATAVNLDSLPETSADSILEAWLNGIGNLIPAETSEPLFQHLLRHDGQIMQALVVSKINIPEETHEEVIESFYILQGRCRCMIDERAYLLGPGDFIEIPLNTNHDVVLLTPYVTAIHQQKALPGKVLA